MKSEEVLEIANEKNVLITDVTIPELIPNVIDNVIINYIDNKFVLQLPDHMIGMIYKKWKTSKGGIFSKDVKSFFNNDVSGKYIIMEESGQKTIARIIEDFEKEEFATMQLIDGKIIDKYYMKLKTINSDEPLTQNNRNTIEEDIEFFKITTQHITPTGDTIEHGQYLYD